jgi:F-type H+-transporting ATPase subunit epsilon
VARQHGHLALGAGKLHGLDFAGIQRPLGADDAPVLTTLKVGVITVTETTGNGMRIYVQGGFADIGVPPPRSPGRSCRG